MDALKKFFAGWIVVALTIAQAGAASFTDTSNSVFSAAIQGLFERGIIEGYSDGSFKPGSPINRAEFLKILIEARYPDTRQPKDVRCFTDLEVPTPQWYARPVCIAAELGIVQGYPDGYFRPEKPVNLAEGLKMAFLTFGILPESTGGQWYEGYLNRARSRGILVNLCVCGKSLLILRRKLFRSWMAGTNAILALNPSHRLKEQGGGWNP